MKILYDLAASQPKGNIKFHGGSEYSKIIFCTLINKSESIIIEAFYDRNREMDERIIELCKEKNVLLHCIDLSKELNQLINSKNYDVVYSALPGEEYLNVRFPLDTKFIFTQHGLRGLELLNDKYDIKYIKNINGKIKCVIKRMFSGIVLQNRLESVKKIFGITSNKQIITDSFHSKNSILWYFPELDENLITVVAPPKKRSASIVKESNVLDNIGVSSKKYLLLVSADRWEKNSYRMIIALKQLIKKRKDIFKDYKVLVLGNENGIIYKKLLTDDIKKHFVFKGYVSTEELEVLYKNAYIFLYPSLNEGFGYPPIEAMKYGTMSVCAADSSITEVCGDAVLYFNPYNINEMSIRVLQSFDVKVREQLKKKMDIHYKRISEYQEMSVDIILDTICS